MWKEISQNFRQSTPFMQLGAHDMPAAEGLGRSAEHDSIPHCSSLLTACFSSNSPCSLSEEDRAKCLPNFNHSQSTSHRKLRTSHRGGAKISKLFVGLFQGLYCLTQSMGCFFLVKQLVFRTNKYDEWQLRKSALGLRLQSTLLPLFAGHICIWVTKGSHTALCCVNVSERVCASLNSSSIQALIVSAPHW